MAGIAAGPRFIHWFTGGSAGTFVPPPRRILQLSDFNPSGKGTVEILGIIEVDKSTDVWWDESTGIGSIADAASDFTLDETGQDTEQDSFSVNVAGDQFNLLREGGAGWSTSFDGTGHLIDGFVYLQTTAGEIAFSVADDLDNVGFGFARFNVDMARRGLLNVLQTGERMIIAVAGPHIVHTLRWPTDILIDWPTDTMIEWPGL